MPRPRNLEATHRIEARIPSSLYAKLQIELYSDLEGRVPFGATSELFTLLVANWLRSRGIVL